MPEDLWPIRPEVTAEKCSRDFLTQWEADGEKATVLRALRSHGHMLARSMMLQFGYTCCNFGTTVCLLFLIGVLSDISVQYWMAWMYGGILVFCSFMVAFFRTHSLLAMVSTVVAVRNAMMTAVYHKATLLSSKALAVTDYGEITNLMSSDSTQIVRLGRWLAIGFMAPVDMLGVFIFLGIVIGPVTCVVLGVLVISLPLNALMAKHHFQARKDSVPLSDKRLKASGEFVKYVRAVKYYAWELFFLDRIQKQRAIELVGVQKVNNTRSYLLQISQAVGSVALLLVLIAYAETGNGLTPATLFLVFRLLLMLRLPFIMLPIALSSVLSLKVSFNRLGHFLRLPELDPTAVDRTGDNVGQVAITNGNFFWGTDSVLKNIDVVFPRNQLTMVIGQVGQGKSSILYALLGDMEKTPESKVQVVGSVAFAAQTAFIFNDTLRDNVLFGKPFNEELYHRALQASDLASDLKQLPGGDMTEIGERGINLSGGQKQRVSLARALYADADVYFLDDCLSAVDAHVGEHIFRNAIQGFLHGKTVILVSNQLQFLPSADYVLAMERGHVREQGRYDDLVSAGADFSVLVEQFGVMKSDEVAKKEAATEAMALELEQYREEHARQEKARQELKISRDADRKKSGMAESADKDRALAGRLVMAEETSVTNYVNANVYWTYIKSGGIVRFCLMCFFLALTAVAAFIPGLWIGYWSVYFLGYDNAFYEGIFGLIVAAEMITYFLGSYIGIAHGVKASEALHTGYLNRLAHAQIAFYDRTPVGRIMNRLAKDMEDIDSMMSFQMQQYVRNVCQILAIVALIGYASPWLLIAFTGLGVIFWAYLRVYRRTSVRLQRIEAVTLSPIFQHFAETLPGLSTIRAFDAGGIEREKSNTYINADTLAEYAARTIDTWIGIRLDLIGALSTAIVVFLFVGLREELNPVLAGFSITYVLTSVNLMSFFSQTMTQLEVMMNAVERIMIFSQQIPIEAAFDSEPGHKPPPEWPSEGRIEFDNVEFTYREGLPPVLKDLSFVIQAGQKVGIVGRTGAGKSSMLVVLLRMAELSGGRVLIDGVDISKIGLHDLRSRVAIIPQDPTVFTGTIRSNLDPFDQYSNEQVWEVLHLAQLKDVVEDDGGLEAAVQEDGLNYSLGQRQLLCMARALLRKPKILLMDEATASGKRRRTLFS